MLRNKIGPSFDLKNVYFWLFFFEISFSLQKEEDFWKTKKEKTETIWTKFWLKKRLFLDQVLTLQHKKRCICCRKRIWSLFALKKMIPTAERSVSTGRTLPNVTLENSDSTGCGVQILLWPLGPENALCFCSPNSSETPIFIVFRGNFGNGSKNAKKGWCLFRGGVVKSALFFLQISGFAFLLLWSCEAAETPYFVVFSWFARFTFYATLWNAQIPNLPSFCGIPIFGSNIVQK